MFNYVKPLAVLGVMAVLTACGDDDDAVVDNVACPIETAGDYMAVIKTVAPDFTSSDVELSPVFPDCNDAVASEANIIPLDQSDYTVNAYEQSFYHIGRYYINTISKHNIDDAINPVYSYSTLDNSEASDSNPHQLVFVNAQKAYLLRYGSSMIWVANPSATSEELFKIGEIDMSAYNDIDVPEIKSGVIVGDKLYVAMQRLSDYNPSVAAEPAYVAVIDVATNRELDTGVDQDHARMGIPLKTRNPATIQYVEGAGLFVQSMGDTGKNYGPVEDQRPLGYSSGIEKINTDDYSTEIVVDDGDVDNNNGLISHMAILSPEVAYSSYSQDWGSNTLFRFNPSTGEKLDASASGVVGQDIRGLTAGPEGFLWVSIADNASPVVKVVDPIDNTLKYSVETILNPTEVVFINTQPTP